MRIDFKGGTMRLPLLPIMAAVVVVVGLVTSVRLGRVDASDVGILINNLTGNVAVRTQPGSFFYNGWMTDLHTIDKTIHTLGMRGKEGEVKIKTSEGADVSLDVEVNYRLLLDEKTILNKLVGESGVDRVRILEYGPRGRRGRRRLRGEPVDAYRQKWIRDYSRAVARYVFGELEAEGFYDATARDEKARVCEKELNALLNVHGIEVLKVVPDEFRFYKEYEDKIDEKNQAKQEVERQKVAAETARAFQERQIVQADKDAEVEIEKIKGTLQKEQIEATAVAVKDSKGAEAYAYTTKVEAEAIFYQAERDAKGVLAAAKAEAESLKNLVAALAGEGGHNLVMRAVAEALGRAEIEGLPYATSPVVQRLSVEGAPAAVKGGKR
ncbi:MAG: hypothetical protein CMJ85_07485 [Planctomycetes bacterium]|nr:hypothetical protein [Planctomycetota bacterium]MDP6424787.1 SPFH domain-containing protein [Planctomycetota bacterium]